MRRAAVAVLVLACTGAALAASPPPLTVLPRPPFNPPVTEPAPSKVHFALVSSKPADPARDVILFEFPPKASPYTYAGEPRLEATNGLSLYGKDDSLARYVLAPGRYVYDFGKYAWPPRIKPGERDYVYEQVVWAKETGGILYTETTNSTYASSSYGLDGYLNAIDLETHRLLWRSPALVANANNFVIAGDTIVSGYGFTAEPDYLYALDRHTGRVLARLLVPSAPERIVRHGTRLTVDTYDHVVVVDLQG